MFSGQSYKAGNYPKAIDTVDSNVRVVKLI